MTKAQAEKLVKEVAVRRLADHFAGVAIKHGDLTKATMQFRLAVQRLLTPPTLEK